MFGILAACAATELPAAAQEAPPAPDLRFGLMTHFAQGLGALVRSSRWPPRTLHVHTMFSFNHFIFNFSMSLFIFNLINSLFSFYLNTFYYHFPTPSILATPFRA